MGFLSLLAVVALGAIAWLLFRIDAKLQAIGDIIHDANRPEEQRRLAAEAAAESEDQPEEAGAEDEPEDPETAKKS